MSTFRHKLYNRCRALAHDERGAVVIIFATTLPVLLGTAALAIDYGYQTHQRANLQRAADAAVLAAAKAYIVGEQTESAVNANARAGALSNGFRDGEDGNLTVLLDDNHIRVMATQSSPRFFSQVFGLDHRGSVTGRAAVQFVDDGTPCVLATDRSPPPLSPGADPVGILVSGQGTITATDCSVHSNSELANPCPNCEGGSIYIRNGHIEADHVTASGQVTISRTGNGSITPAAVQAPARENLLDGLQTPDHGECDYNNTTLHTNASEVIELEPGVYCGGVSISNGARVIFNPGTYIFKDGPLTVGGGARVESSSGVSFFFSGSNIGVSMENGARVKLEAPLSGPHAGILMHMDPPPDGETCTAEFRGGVRYDFGGAMNMPRCDLDVTDGVRIDSPLDSFTMMIARTISISGGARMAIKMQHLYGLPAMQEATNLSYRFIE